MDPIYFFTQLAAQLSLNHLLNKLPFLSHVNCSFYYVYSIDNHKLFLRYLKEVRRGAGQAPGGERAGQEKEQVPTP